MSRPTLIAAALMFFTCGIHVFLGQPEVHGAIQNSDLHPVLRAISAVLWHAVTLQLLAFTAALLWAARYPNRPLSYLIATICLCYTALFLAIGLTMLQTPWPMPQWVIFGALAALIFWGARPATAT